MAFGFASAIVNGSRAIRKLAPFDPSWSKTIPGPARRARSTRLDSCDKILPPGTRGN